MKQVVIDREYASWRAAARALLASGKEPEAVVWTEAGAEQAMLPLADESASPAGTDRGEMTVPREFVRMAPFVACHRDLKRWDLLYRLLWRLTHGCERHLLDIAVDPDVSRAQLMHASVRRDIHKMHAFVRFRRVVNSNGDNERFIAWHRPDHYIVRHASPFFARRFKAMRWSILTPDESAHWDGERLTFTEGVARSPIDGDDLEQLWLTYYASIFNPARLKLRAMRKEMPRRYWHSMPETQLIPELVASATQRTEAMMAKRKSVDSGNPECPTTTSAADFVPDRLELPVLAAAAQKCRGCELYCHATQAVFGEGPRTASVMFVGEQPGDQEDLAGKPFVGPAGQVLNETLEQVGIDRSEVFVTNAVKHFKFEPRGKRRIHAKPSAREVAACRPWLEAEIASVKPKLIVCLGATAAQSLMGRDFRITKDRGKVFEETSWAPGVVATIHPSAILRMPDADARAEARRNFIDDLKVVKREMSKISRARADRSAEKLWEVHPTVIAASGDQSAGLNAGVRRT